MLFVYLDLGDLYAEPWKSDPYFRPAAKTITVIECDL